MTYIGHITSASVVALALQKICMFENENFMIFYALCIFGSLLPDIDEPDSYIGKRTIVISNIISLIFKHRGITHSLAFAMIFIVLGIVFNEYRYMLASVSLGILVHIFGDMATIAGIKYMFFPFATEKSIHILPRFMTFKTGGIIEKAVVIPLLMILNGYLLLSIDFQIAS